MTAATEIAVAGGGPAGAVIALRLAELGHRVVLLAGARNPRPHLGESLAPGVAAQLAFLGLGNILDLALVHRTTEFELKWRTDHFEPHTAMQPGLLVDRGAFDAALVGTAARRGVDVRAATMARVAERNGGGWRIACECPEGPLVLTAPILIDATGRRGLLPKRRRRTYRLLAVHGRVRGARLPACIRVAAGDSSWAWGAPMPDGTYAAAVFLEPRDVKTAGKDIEERFRKLVSRCGLLDGAGASETVGSIEACDATPYVDDDAVGSDFLKIGDAALAVDPISSAGVQIAIQSAITGAAAIHTLRRDPSMAEAVCEFWRRELARRNASHRTWSGEFYGEAHSRFATPFWRSRVASRADAPTTATRFDGEPLPRPDQQLGLARSVEISMAPCITGNTIEWRHIATHPSLTEPVAFVDGIDLPHLLARIAPSMTAAAILRAWSSSIDPGRALALLSWAWRHRLIEPLVSSS
jgi:flavin-dependent dehydrogenase